MPQALKRAPLEKVPDGYDHLDRMILSAARHDAEISCCGICMDARGIDDDHLAKGARRSTLDELADWTIIYDAPSDVHRWSIARRVLRGVT